MDRVDVRTSGTERRMPPDLRGRRGLAIGVLAVAVAAGAWWWLSTPSLSSGGVASVTSPDHDVHVVTGPGHTTQYVVPADTPGETTLVFELGNEGRLPLRLVDVWPDDEDPSCWWTPRLRELRDDPRTMYSRDEPSRPAVGATIPPGGFATVWLTGAQHDSTMPCYHGGMAVHDTVDVVVAIAGRTSTVAVPLGYSFAYADDPEKITEQYGVTVVPPDPSARVE